MFFFSHLQSKSGKWVRVHIDSSKVNYHNSKKVVLQKKLFKFRLYFCNPGISLQLNIFYSVFFSKSIMVLIFSNFLFQMFLHGIEMNMDKYPSILKWPQSVAVLVVSIQQFYRVIIQLYIFQVMIGYFGTVDMQLFTKKY